jgi:DNA-binding beta-propeller fold protein YncE
MSRSAVLVSAAVMLLLVAAGAQQSSSSGPYKVLKTVKVGGEGGFDYISADVDARRLYVPRNGPMGHLSVYNLDTLDPIGEIPGVSAGGAAVDPQSHHGFSTSKPVTMWDANTLKVIRTIDVDGRPDGILFDPFNHRVWVFSHVAPNATVIDASDGSVVKTLDLGGAPEQAVSDGKGTIYVNLTDKTNVAVIDAKTLTVAAHYDMTSKGSNAGGLAFDEKNQILFSYIHQPTSMAVIMSSKDGHIITTLPVGEGVDTVAFNPKTMEAISADGAGTMTIIKESSPTKFSVEQTLTTLPRAKTMVLDTKTGHVISMTAEFGPAPAAPAGDGRPARAPMIPGTFTLLMVGR